MSALAQATFGGGCFWCLEPVFAAVQGVKEGVPGYVGGHKENPTYEEVCTGTTGHAEVVQITYDPEQVSYRDLLEIVFAVHDPATLTRQGADVSTQYRSVIFYHSDQQEAEAREYIAQLDKAGVWPNPIVTEVAPYETFYPAEDYHWDYFRRNPYQPYCQVVIAPKVAKFRRQFAEKLKG